LKIAVTVLILAYIINRHGWQRIAGTVAQADYRWLLAGLGLFFASGVLGVRQWQILLHNRGISLPFVRAFVLYYIGMFFNNFMFGMVAGDAVRVTLIHANEGNAKAGLAATLLDRFAGLWAMSGFAMAGCIILLRQEVLRARQINIAIVALGATFTGFTLICAFLISRRLQHFSFRVIARLPKLASEPLGNALRGLVFEVRDRHILLPIGLLSTTVQCMRIGVHLTAAASLSLLTGSNYYYFFMFVPILAILMLIPLPFGVKETLGGRLFLLAGFSPSSPEEPLVMEFLASLIGIVASLLGGFLFMTQKLKHPAAIAKKNELPVSGENNPI
jgi:glycosyltransferase 2 family protein